MMDIPQCPDDLESLFKKEWKDPELQEKFLGDFDLYRAYRWAEERGAIKYKLGYDGDLEKISRAQQQHYGDTKAVKLLAKAVNIKTVKTQTRNAGKASATTRTEQADMLHGSWMEIARLLRMHNPDIPIPEIADRIIEYIEKNDSEFDFKPQRSKGTIENYLRDNL